MRSWQQVSVTLPPELWSQSHLGRHEGNTCLLPSPCNSGTLGLGSRSPTFLDTHQVSSYNIWWHKHKDKPDSNVLALSQFSINSSSCLKIAFLPVTCYLISLQSNISLFWFLQGLQNSFNSRSSVKPGFNCFSRKNGVISPRNCNEILNVLRCDIAISMCSSLN